MASLTGQTVSSTYDGLLKTEDNDILGVGPKQITDGLGNGTGMTLSTTGDVGISGDLTLDGALIDSNGVSGSSGQILASTGVGTDWIDLTEISGVDGSGTANYVPKWTDGDTIGNSVIYDNGTNVGIGDVTPSTKLEVNGVITATGGNSTEWNEAYDSSITNAANISTNATNIATNVTNIATNATNIAAINTTSNIHYKVVGLTMDYSNRVLFDGGIAEGTEAVMETMEDLILG